MMVAWATPRTWVTNEVIEAAYLNETRDNLLYLYGARGSFAILTDQKTDGTAGGATAAGTWNARDLNTEVSDIDSIVTIASNRFTPVAGTYLIRILTTTSTTVSSNAPASEQVRLFNFTAGAVVSGVISKNRNTTTTGIVALENTDVEGEGIFVANGTDSYRIDMYSQNSIGGGLGSAQGGNSAEIYTVVRLQKIG